MEGVEARPRAASAGTSVTATSSEATIEAVMVKINSRKSRPTSPLMNRNGTTAARLVEVAAMIGLLTSEAAFAAAEFLMDYLKTRAPFWKQVEAPAGKAWVEAKEADDAAADRWRKRREAAE